MDYLANSLTQNSRSDSAKVGHRRVSKAYNTLNTERRRSLNEQTANFPNPIEMADRRATDNNTITTLNEPLVSQMNAQWARNEAQRKPTKPVKIGNKKRNSNQSSPNAKLVLSSGHASPEPAQYNPIGPSKYNEKFSPDRNLLQMPGTTHVPGRDSLQ